MKRKGERFSAFESNRNLGLILPKNNKKTCRLAGFFISEVFVNKKRYAKEVWQAYCLL
jgi:hypothetical protein